MELLAEYPCYSENSKAGKDLEYLCEKSRSKDIVLGCYCENEKLCLRIIIAGILLGLGTRIEADPEYRKYYEMYQLYI